MNNNLSESIFQKRLKRFKSIKRGYYSLIILVSLYVLSLLSPLWINNKPLIVKYSNGKWEKGETYIDSNNNNIWDDAEKFIDSNNNGIYDLGEEFIDIGNGEWDWKDLNDNGIWDKGEGEEFVDENNNGIRDNGEIIPPNLMWDSNEPFIDKGNGVWDPWEEFIDEGNGTWDIGEQFTDMGEEYIKDGCIISNKNGIWDEGEGFIDQGNGIYDLGEEFIDIGNGTWDTGEKFEDLEQIMPTEKFTDVGDGIWNEGEEFVDEKHYFFPAFWDLMDFIPGIEYPVYESSYFNQNINQVLVDFRLLDKDWEKQNSDNYIIMPLYPYHPHEDLKDELDELYQDSNNNGAYDLGEVFIDENGDGEWTQNNPPTKPDGFGGRHLLGTDNTGRDIFARVIDGFKVSITFAVVCTFLSYSIGIILGAILGYFGGKVDLFGVRIMEIFSALPFLFIVMILSSFMTPNLFMLAAILVFLSGWIGLSYFIRGEFYREKAKDYVSAAVSMGASNTRVMFKHILPNALTPIITFGPFAIIGYIGTLNMLDLLGYGLQPPAASWGEILKQALENLDNWHMLVFPIIAMTVTLFMITFIGEAIREAFDPKVYSRLR